MGAFAQHVARDVHAFVAGDHLRARLAAGMDRDHHHLRADLLADAQALQYRPDPVGDAGVRELAGGVPVAAGRDVGVLPQGRLAAARHAQPDFRRHDALHGGHHPVHDHHVPLARYDSLAAELPLWRLRRGGEQEGARAASTPRTDDRGGDLLTIVHDWPQKSPGRERLSTAMADDGLVNLTATEAAAEIARGAV